MNLYDIAKTPLKSILIEDKQISKFISKYRISPSINLKIPNSVIYELYKYWHLTLGRQIYKKRYSQRQFFRKFKIIFPKCYKTGSTRGYYLNKEAFMPYLKFTGDKVHEEKIQPKRSG